VPALAMAAPVRLPRYGYLRNAHNCWRRCCEVSGGPAGARLTVPTRPVCWRPGPRRAFAPGAAPACCGQRLHVPPLARGLAGSAGPPFGGCASPVSLQGTRTRSRAAHHAHACRVLRSLLPPCFACLLQPRRAHAVHRECRAADAAAREAAPDVRGAGARVAACPSFRELLRQLDAAQALHELRLVCCCFFLQARVASLPPPPVHSAAPCACAHERERHPRAARAGPLAAT
jgi:hypothetical protein